MNYIAEIKAFYDWVMTKQLSTGQIALWHGLMHINNKCAWQEWFSVPNLTLELHTGLSRSGIAKARNTLKQLGILDFKTNGTKATQYKLNTMVKSTQDGNPNGAQSSKQSGKQDHTQSSGTFNKQNETKQNNSCGGGAREANAFALSAQQTEDLRCIGQAYENDIGVIPSSAMQEMHSFYLEQGISATVIVKAIQTAAENNARTWSYVRSILTRCVKEQIVTLADWETAEQRKKERHTASPKAADSPTGNVFFDILHREGKL